MRSFATGAIYFTILLIVFVCLVSIDYGSTWLLCGGQSPYWAGHNWSCPVKIAP